MEFIWEQKWRAHPALRESGGGSPDFSQVFGRNENVDV
jgi:hypothetical protein